MLSCVGKSSARYYYAILILKCFSLCFHSPHTPIKSLAI